MLIPMLPAEWFELLKKKVFLFLSIKYITGNSKITIFTTRHFFPNLNSGHFKFSFQDICKPSPVWWSPCPRAKKTGALGKSRSSLKWTHV